MQVQTLCQTLYWYMPPAQSYLTLIENAWNINLWRTSLLVLNQTNFSLICTLGSLAPFIISVELCWFATSKELAPDVQNSVPALQQWKHFTESSAREIHYPPKRILYWKQLILLSCSMLLFHQIQGKLQRAWRKTSAKFLHICSYCTNCSHWNSPAPFVQQRTGAWQSTQYHMHNERRKTIVKWWAKTTYRLRKVIDFLSEKAPWINM